MNAGLFIETGIYENYEKFIPLLNNPNKTEIFKLIHAFTNIISSSNIITTAIDKASKVVFALKNYARTKSSFEPEQIDIKESIETILILYQNKMKTGVATNFNFDFEGQITGYPDELSQIWTNLIFNALQAMDYSGKLSIEVKQNDNSVNVIISDTGKGIPDDIKDKIFEPFFTTKPLGEGIGLGLDIVKKIVDKHNGTIDFVSVPGKGTTFTVSLPLS